MALLARRAAVGATLLLIYNQNFSPFVLKSMDVITFLRELIKMIFLAKI